MEKVSLTFRFIADQIKGYKKNKNNKTQIKNYYLISNNDSRSNFARLIDYVIWRIIVFFILFIFIYLKTERLYISTIVTSIIIFIIHSIAIRGRNYKLKQMKKQKRRYIAGQRVYNEIMNKTIDEMQKYIKDLFSHMNFSEFNFIKSAQRYILLEALYKKEEIMILLYIYKNNFDVELKEVKEFIHTMTDNKVKKGILITMSDFTNDSYDFINKLNEQYKLLLINKEQFLSIIEQNGLFPKEEEIDEIIESKISRKVDRWNKYKKTVLSKNKIKGYIVVSLYLVLTAWYTPYIVYYIIVASITLALAVITFIFNIINSSETDKEKSVDFEQLFTNM